MSILDWALALWLALLMTGVSGFAVYAAMYQRPKEDTPWVGKLVYHFGHVLVVAVPVIIAGGVFGVVATAVMKALR